jgi:uncharacterized membrane protein
MAVGVDVTSRDGDVPGAERELSAPPRWLPILALVLSIAGLAVSTYLTVEHYTGNSSLICSSNAAISCKKVTTSPQSMVFGVLPVAVLGLAFFVAMTVINLPRLWRSSDERVAWVRLALAVVGMGMVIYLLSAELFSIRAICLWCTSVHIITFAIFVLVVLSFAAMSTRNTKTDTRSV